MRFPDKPGLEIRREHLPGFAKGWLCQVKADGWRCLVDFEVGRPERFTYTSCSGKPIDVAPEVREPFEHRIVATCGHHGIHRLVLDTELMGNRRAGDVKDIAIIDVLQVDEDEQWDSPAENRATRAASLFGIYGDGAGGLVLPFTTGEVIDCCAMYECFRESSPWAEGVVLKRFGSVHVGSSQGNFKNKSWIKCKWRAGESGTTPKE